MKVFFFIIPIILIAIFPVVSSYGQVDSHLYGLHPVNTTKPVNTYVNYSNIQNYTSYIPLSKSQLIGIQLSQACISMEKNHVKSSCLTYDKLRQFDNTDPFITGHWVNDTWYHKVPGKIKNTWQFGLAKQGNYTVSVDPTAGYTTLAKMIIVQSGNFTYINSGADIGDNHTRTEYYNRFVSGCESATVAPNILLIADTIQYLESGCTKTNFVDSKIIHTGNKPVTRDNPFSSLIHDAYLRTMMNGHSFFSGNHTTGGLGPGNCITHKCIYTDPYHKKGW